ncbi:MAG: hypothetical protein ACSHX9_01935 [Luteolibacter sp.]
MKKAIILFSAGVLCAVVVTRLVTPPKETPILPSTQKVQPAENVDPQPPSDTPAPLSSGQASNKTQSKPAEEIAPSPVEPRPVPAEVAGLLEDLKLANEEQWAGKVMEITELWVSKDPAGALAWAFNLQKGSDRVVASVAMRDWGRKDPAGVLESIRALESGNPDLANYATHRLFSQWAMDDPEAAMEAAATIADPKQFGEIEAGILAGWGESDPISAASILDNKIKSGSDLSGLTDAFGTIANSYALTDPTAAAKWTNSLPDGAAKSTAVSSLMNSWLSEDPEAASSWLRELEPGQTRDDGIGALVLISRNRDPQRAFQWAESISSPQQRTRLTKLAALSWLSVSPEIARDELQRSSILTQAEREEIFAIHQEHMVP